MNRISIVFASDDNYAQHLAVACASILKNAAHPEKIYFYILSDNIFPENQNRIVQTVHD